MTDPSNLGRCDVCGEPIDLSGRGEEQELHIEEFGGEGIPVSAQQASDAVADALERLGGPKNEMLADHIREEHGYKVDGECYEETGLSELPRA